MLTLSTPQHISTQNYLLAALPAAAYARLLPDLELTSLGLVVVLYESGGPRVCECYAVVKRKSDRLLSRNAPLVGQLS